MGTGLEIDSKFVRGVLGAVLAFGVLLAQEARAQDSAQNGALTLPAIVVSATTVPTPASDVASSVTVITAQDIARRQVRTVPDLLNTVPGLNVVQNGTAGAQTSIFMRGTNSNHVKVLVDGIDISDPSTPTGAVDLAHLLTDDIAQVEVLRGPQSGLYGANAIGGVIAITTKKGSGPPKASATLEGGSFGTFNQSAHLSGGDDRFDYAFSLAHFRATDMPVTPPYMVPPGGQAIGNSYDNRSFSTRLGAKANDMLRFNLYGHYTDAKLLYSDDNPAAFPGVTFPTQSTYKNRDFYGRAESVVTLLDGRFVNTFGVNYTDYNRSNKDPEPNPLTIFKSRRDKYDWHGALTLAPGQVLVAGLERENDRATSDNLAAKTGNQGGFLELQSSFAKRFFFVANARHDDHDAFGGHNTWRVAPAVILPVTDTKLKGSYGTGFKAPDLYQLYGNGPFGFVGNPNLRPETSIGYDYGFEQPLFNDRVRFGATYFHNSITNLINNVFAPVFTYVNVGKAATYGAEAFVAVTVNDHLRARLDYTRTTAKDLITGMDLLRRPRHKYAVTADWQPTDRLTLSPTVLYIGRWVDIDRSTFVRRDGGGVWLVNLAANYLVSDHVTVFARADNIFDRRWENPLGWEQPGFAVFGGVKLATN
jgi:vitamin B12 transporter